MISVWVFSLPPFWCKCTHKVPSGQSQGILTKMGTITYKIKIMLYSVKLKTIKWDNKLVKKVLIKVREMTNVFIFSLWLFYSLYSLPFFRSDELPPAGHFNNFYICFTVQNHKLHPSFVCNLWATSCYSGTCF